MLLATLNAIYAMFLSAVFRIPRAPFFVSQERGQFCVRWYTPGECLSVYHISLGPLVFYQDRR